MHRRLAHDDGACCFQSRDGSGVHLTNASEKTGAETSVVPFHVSFILDSHRHSV